jgi:non-specific serine/threonine protein kinase
MVAALAEYWETRGYWTEGRAWFREALAVRREQSAWTRAEALRGAATLAVDQGDPKEAKELYKESLSLWRDLGDLRGAARALGGLSLIEYESAVTQGDLDRARRLRDESMAAFREAGDAGGVAVMSGNAGYHALIEGDRERARMMLEESLRISRELGDDHVSARALHNLAFVGLVEGQSEEVAELFVESMRLGRDDKRGLISSIVGVAALAADLGQPKQAAKLLGSVDGWLAMTGGALEPFERTLHDRTSAAVRRVLKDETFRAAWQTGRAMTLEQAGDYAAETAGAARAPRVEPSRSSS